MKIKELYNLKSFQDANDSGKRVGIFTDAAANGVVLAQNLRHVDLTIFEKLYPELVVFNMGLTIDNAGGYANVIDSLRLNEQGDFKTSGDIDSNKGKISLSGDKSFLNVLSREAHAEWSRTEVEQANLQNINLVNKYLSTVDKVYKRNIDKIVLTGIDDYASSTGLLNYSGFTSAGASGAVSTLSGQDAYDEVAEFITDQHNGVNNTAGYMADKIIFPVSVMNALQRKILNSAGSSKSVLTALRENFVGVEFLSTFRAESVGGSTVTLAIASSEQAVKIRIPQPLEISEIVKISGFDYRVDAAYRVAGADILENSAGRILTGF